MRGEILTTNAKIPERSHPFPAWEGVLATEIGQLGNMEGCDFCNEAAD